MMETMKGTCQEYSVAYMQGPVLLVSRIYRCDHGHEIRAHNEGLQTIFSEKECIIISHIVFSKDLLHNVHSLISVVKCTMVESIIAQQVRRDRMRRLTNLYASINYV